MRNPSKLLVTLICIFIIAFKFTSAAAFVQNGLGLVHKINGIASKNFCPPKPFNLDIKNANYFQFSSHVLGYLESDPKPEFKSTKSSTTNISEYSNPRLKIISSRIFRPPRSVA
jgi:hypothetical protein